MYENKSAALLELRIDGPLLGFHDLQRKAYRVVCQLILVGKTTGV